MPNSFAQKQNDIYLYKSTRKQRKKDKQRPLTEKRKVYLETYPCLSQRLHKTVISRFYRDADALGLNYKDYLSRLIMNTSVKLDDAEKKAFEAGKTEGDNLGYQRGLKDGAVENADKLYRWAYQEARGDYAINLWCGVPGCNYPIFITKGDPIHMDLLRLTAGRYMCKNCEYRRIIERPTEE